MHYSELKTLPTVRLRAYARDVLGAKLESDERWARDKVNRPWMLEMICQLHNETSNPIQGIPGSEKAAIEVGKEKRGESRVKVLIHPDEMQPEYVFLGHNGDNVMVQRDVEVMLPLRFLECLRHARMDVTEFDKEGEIRRVKSIPRYHYTVLEAPQEAAAL